MLAVLVSLVCLTKVAVSSPARDGGKSRPGVYQAGPVYLTPRLELKNAGVDTNVFNSQNAVPDASVVLSPSLTGVLPIGRRFRLTGSGVLDFNYFRREGDERSIDFAGEGCAEVDLARFTFFGGGGGGQFRQRFSIDLDERVRRQEKWATTGALVRVTNKISVTFAGTGRVFAFDPTGVGRASIQQALERNELTGTTQLRYAITSQTTLLASADIIEDRFLKQQVGPARARSRRYLGGLELGERAVINGKVLAGVRQFLGSEGSAAYRGPALSVSASVPILRFGRFSALAERDVFYSITGGTGSRRDAGFLRNGFVATALRGDATLELPLLLIGRGFFGFQEAKYLLPYSSNSASGRRVDHFWSAGGSLSRRIGSKVAVGGNVSWGRRVSNIPGFSYEGLRYGVQAEIVP